MLLGGGGSILYGSFGNRFIVIRRRIMNIDLIRITNNCTGRLMMEAGRGMCMFCGGCV